MLHDLVRRITKAVDEEVVSQTSLIVEVPSLIQFGFLLAIRLNLCDYLLDLVVSSLS